MRLAQAFWSANQLYSWDSFRCLVMPAKRPFLEKIPALFTAVFPGLGAYLLVKLMLDLFPHRFQGTRWELTLSPYSPKRQFS